MAQKLSAKTQLAIGLAAMAATMAAISPAKSHRIDDTPPPAAGLFGSLKQPEPPRAGGYENF